MKCEIIANLLHKKKANEKKLLMGKVENLRTTEQRKKQTMSGWQ